MKAICPRCSHVMYWFNDDQFDLSPEALRSAGLDTRCEYDGAACVSAPWNQGIHNCRNCKRHGIVDARDSFEKDQFELF